MTGFFVVLLAVNVARGFYSSLWNIPKDPGTALCFIIGFVPPYAYVWYNNRRRGGGAN